MTIQACMDCNQYIIQNLENIYSSAKRNNVIQLVFSNRNARQRANVIRNLLLQFYLLLTSLIRSATPQSTS